MATLLANWKLILILVLTVLLASIGFLYRNSVERVGQLKEANTELSRQVKQAELDKERLQATIDGNARISEQDELDRKKLSDQVVQLNSSINKLSKEKNVLKKQVGKNANTCQDGSDLELSDDLSRMLNEARDKANSSGNAAGKPAN